MSIWGVDDRFGVGGVEVFFDGFNQPVIKFLGGFGCVSVRIFEGGTEVNYGLVEFFAGDVDGAADRR